MIANCRRAASVSTSCDRPSAPPGRGRQILILFLLLAAPGAAVAAEAAPALARGDVFPDLARFALEGELPAAPPARVTIVDFWASWCAPCRASFPVYDELHDTFGARGLRIIGVSVDTEPEAMRRFIARLQPKFTVVRDAEQRLVAAVAVPAMPTAYVLDAQGVVRFVHRGFNSGSRREYIAEISALLSQDR